LIGTTAETDLMDQSFWLERWAANEIGFHEADFNPALVHHWPRLHLAAGATVFVPLCGKSLDLLWLAKQGFRVVGVELSDIAVQAFYAENGLSPEIRETSGHKVYRYGSIEIWQGDLFTLPGEATEAVSAVYDRASIIAFPPEMQPRYAERMIELTVPGTRTLLITIEYDQSRMDGPPFAAPEDSIASMFGGACEIQLIRRDDILTPDHRFRQRGKGLAWLNSAVYVLERKEAVH
jgi:thiopurine S-methyltransferase